MLIGAVPPLMLKTAANPGGLPIEVFDQIRAGVLADRSQFFKDLSAPFYGANRPGAKVSQGLRASFWLQGMQAGFKGVIDCIKAFSETDFTEDLKKFNVPTLILHGDDDQIVPIGASALLSSKLVKGATLKVYPGAAHGMCSTLKDQVNADLLAFLKALAGPRPSASRGGRQLPRPLRSRKRRLAMFKTKNDLPEATRVKAVELLNARLADCIDLQTQTKQAHWNVKGSHFIALHELFDKISEAVEDYVDDIAEQAVATRRRGRGDGSDGGEAGALSEYPASVDGRLRRNASTALAVFGKAARWPSTRPTN